MLVIRPDFVICSAVKEEVFGGTFWLFQGVLMATCTFAFSYSGDQSFSPLPLVRRGNATPHPGFKGVVGDNRGPRLSVAIVSQTKTVNPDPKPGRWILDV